MVVGDNANSYVELIMNGKSEGNLWNYGAEVWCNMPGQFVTILADLSTLNNAYLMSVCNLGIFGTKYEHPTPIPSQISIKPY